MICAHKADIKMDVGTKHNGGDWDGVNCGAGYTLIGGGCNAGASPHVMQKSGPVGNGWQCGGHGGSKHTYAMCAKQGTRQY